MLLLLLRLLLALAPSRDTAFTAHWKMYTPHHLPVMSTQSSHVFFCTHNQKRRRRRRLHVNKYNYCDGSPSLTIRIRRTDLTAILSKSILFSSATARRHYHSCELLPILLVFGFIYHHTTRNRTAQKAPPTRKLISRMTQKSHFTRRGIVDPFLSST